MSGELKAQAQSNNPERPERILIVEDEMDLAELLEYSLRKAGFETDIAGDGLEACRLVGEFHPDLILLDILLPMVDGWEVCRMIRSHPDDSVSFLPIIMLTALDFPEHRIRGLELGADLYLPKPYSIPEIVLYVRRLLDDRRRRQQLENEVRLMRSHFEAQDDIQGMLFHELRNHLQVIGGFSNILERQNQDASSDPTRSYAAAIHRSSDYLATLAEEFILVRRIENGNESLPLEEFDLEQLLKELVELYRGRSEDRQIDLSLEMLTPFLIVRLNRPALKIVLSNLLDNALKYSNAGGEVTLRAGLDTDGSFCLDVSDSAPPIGKDEEEKIFERFKRGSKAGEDIPGTGLGLYGGRIFARKMGGELILVSASPGGNCFRVSFARFR